MTHVYKSLAGILALLLLTAGCGGRRVHMTPATTVPGAMGVAQLTKDKNGNVLVDLKVKHLARPDALTPPQSVYIVWLQPRGGQVMKEGELRVNDNLEGEFKTPAPSRNFDIFVTAESGPNVTQPTGQEVLRQTVTQS